MLSLGTPRGRGGRGGRGRGTNGVQDNDGQGGRGEAMPSQNVDPTASPGPPKSVSAMQRADLAIQSTDNDAMGSRLSAVIQRYIPHDPYTPLLASSEASTSATLARRSPIINYGTYLRSTAIDLLVDRFLSSETGTEEKQIISLGAGSDSRFWRLRSRLAAQGRPNVLRHYVELDFARLTKAKLERIVRHKDLLELVSPTDSPLQKPDVSLDGTSFQSERYSLLACDLRTLPADESVKAKILGHIDPTVDTLVIAECVLAYLSPHESQSLLAYFGSILQRPFGICYEMCVAGGDSQNAQDQSPSRFGTVMLSNLDSRGLTMPGARAYSTLASHALRFEVGFNNDPKHKHESGQGHARTLKHVWQSQDEAEKARLSRLEGLDEVEELDILLAHYAISWYAFDAKLHAPFLEDLTLHPSPL